MVVFLVAFAAMVGAGSAGKPEMEAASMSIKLAVFAEGVLVSIFLIAIIALILSAIRRKEESFGKWLITLSIALPLFSTFAGATKNIETTHSVDISRLNLLGAISIDLVSVSVLSLVAIAIWKKDVWAKWFLISFSLLIAKAATSISFRFATQDFR